MSAKLTETQCKVLLTASFSYRLHPGPDWASSARSLVRRGLLERMGIGAYIITEADLFALQAAKGGKE